MIYHGPETTNQKNAAGSGARVARKEIAPRAKEFDETGTFPREIVSR